jgi:hypothetical protein
MRPACPGSLAQAAHAGAVAATRKRLECQTPAQFLSASTTHTFAQISPPAPGQTRSPLRASEHARPPAAADMPVKSELTAKQGQQQKAAHDSATRSLGSRAIWRLGPGRGSAAIARVLLHAMSGAPLRPSRTRAPLSDFGLARARCDRGAGNYSCVESDTARDPAADFREPSCQHTKRDARH